eukprot:scaffold24527_cov199-Amphora_coffeaeformis.AAC.1
MEKSKGVEVWRRMALCPSWERRRGLRRRRCGRIRECGIGWEVSVARSSGGCRSGGSEGHDVR